MRSSAIAPLSISSSAVGGVLLHAQHAQRRAALARAVEGRRPSRRRPPVPRAPTSRRSSRSARRSRRSAAPARPCATEPLRERLLQDARNLGRAGEHHALHARVGRPARAPTVSPATRQQLHRARAARRLPTARAPPRPRSAASVRRAWPAPGCPRRARPPPGPVKIASGKFHGLMHTTGRARGACRSRSRARLRRVVAQEVDRLAHFGDGVGVASFRLRASAGPAGGACRSSSRPAARSSWAARSAGGVAAHAGCDVSGLG